MSSFPEPAPSGTSRRSAVRWLRWVALAAVLGFVTVFLVDNWPGIAKSLSQLGPLALAGSIALAVLGLLAAMLSWRAVLEGLGSALPVRAAARVYFLSQLGKYVPGSVWPVLAQAELSKAYGVPPARAGFAAMAQLLIGMVSGIIVAGVTLALSSTDALHTYWWLAVVALGGLVALLPPVFNRWVAVLMAIIRRPGLVEPMSARTMAVAAGWCLAMWACFGAHLWLLAFDLGAAAPRLGLLTTGAFAVAWVVGFVIIFVPAGAGAREATLVLVLSAALSADRTLALALASRFVMLIGDGTTAVAAAAAERRTLRARGRGNVTTP